MESAGELQPSPRPLRQVSFCPAGSDRRDASRLSGRDPSLWTVEDVMQFVREADPQFGPHADLFRKHVGAPAQPLLYPPGILLLQFIDS